MNNLESVPGCFEENKRNLGVCFHSWPILNLKEVPSPRQGRQ